MIMVVIWESVCSFEIAYVKRNNVVIKIRDYGRVVGSRKTAEEIRNKIVDLDSSVLDFAEVDTVSHCFADELIGKLAELKGKDVFKTQVKIINLKESNRSMLLYVIEDRLK